MRLRREKIVFNKSIYREDIQILRGIAVLSVILFHANKNLFPMGYLGVDVFFVISGFVVTPLIIRIFQDKSYNFGQKIINMRNFYRRRFYRLAPALTGTLIFSSVIIFFFGNINDHERFAKQGLATLLLVGNLGAYKYNIDYFSPNPNPLLHTWSLAVEEQIYIVLPFMLLAILGIFRKFQNLPKIFLYISIGMAILSFISYVLPTSIQYFYSLVGVRSTQQFSFYSALSRIWQFLVGGILFIFFSQQVRIRKSVHIASSIFVIVTICIILFSRIQIEARIGSILVSILTLFVIAFASLNLLPFRLSNILIWFGDRSYSLYLLHLPILYIAKYSPILKFGTNGELQMRIFIGISFTLILGNFSFIFLENRFRDSKNHKLAIEITKVQAITFFLSMTVIFGGMYKVASLGLLQDPNRPTTNEVSPQDWDVNCKFHQPSNPPRTQPCRYSSGMSDKNFLLIGDSHAGHLSQTIIRIGRIETANVYVFTHSACPFIIDQTFFSNKDYYPLFTLECMQHNRAILNFMNDVKIDTVFYTQRSTVPYVLPNTLQSREKLNYSIMQGLTKLEFYANKLIFLGITPEYVSIDSLVLKLFGSRGFYHQIPSLDNNYWRNALSSSEMKYVDLYGKFCTSMTLCKNQIDGEWLFVDNDHLSQAGGRFIEPEIIKSLK
jgi:peptidoglycan/LPS O-acetylase OafA/YrhL